MRRQTDKKRKDRWTDASHPFYECQRLPLLLFSLSNVRCASDSLFIGRVFRRDPISSKREGPSRSFRATHHCSRSFPKSIETPEACPRFSSDRATAPLSIGNEYIGFGMVFGIHSYRCCDSEESAAVCTANINNVDKTACDTNEAKGGSSVFCFLLIRLHLSNRNTHRIT